MFMNEWEWDPTIDIKFSTIFFWFSKKGDIIQRKLL